MSPWSRGNFNTQGLIAYRHGQVTVLDRRRLEARSCECSGIVRPFFNAFLRRLPN